MTAFLATLTAIAVLGVLSIKLKGDLKTGIVLTVHLPLVILALGLAVLTVYTWGMP